MQTPRTPSVAAVVALKAGPYAKSRLASVPDPLRRRLAWTMALDTLTALASAVDELCVVSDQPDLAERLREAGIDAVLQPETRHGMNEALRDGAALVRGRGADVVLACVGDLPALTAASVRVVLAGSAPHPRAFLPDATGVGTTMLVARGVDLDPYFQGRSAARHHASGAVALTDALLVRPVPDARRDVDTEVDLDVAVPLGLGPWTSALVDPATGRLGTYREGDGRGADEGPGTR